MLIYRPAGVVEINELHFFTVYILPIILVFLVYLLFKFFVLKKSNIFYFKLIRYSFWIILVVYIISVILMAINV